jgi:hypothetical protein
MEFALLMNAAQSRELHRLIDRSLAAMRVEISHTDSRQFRDDLNERLTTLEEIHRKLEEIEPTIAVLR